MRWKIGIVFLDLQALYSILVYFLNVKHRKVHFIYLLYFTIFIIGALSINILNLFHGEDLSLFAFVAMSVPLILRTRILFYAIIYLFIVIGFTLCLATLHMDKINGLTITKIFLYSFVGFMTTLTIEYARRKTFHLEEELRRKNTILESISVKDPLTGVFNRRYMMDLLVHHINRSGKWFSLPIWRRRIYNSISRNKSRTCKQSNAKNQKSDWGA